MFQEQQKNCCWKKLSLGDVNVPLTTIVWRQSNCCQVFDDKKIVVNVLPQKSPAEPSEFRFNSMSVNLLFIVAFKSEKRYGY